MSDRLLIEDPALSVHDVMDILGVSRSFVFAEILPRPFGSKPRAIGSFARSVAGVLGALEAEVRVPPGVGCQMPAPWSADGGKRYQFGTTRHP